MANQSPWKILLKKKNYRPQVLELTLLNRCLRLYDLTAIGLGATLGATAYVLVGMVALENSGPSLCISFLIAASSSMLAGLSYAELGSRMPKAGSVYEYAYACVGEFLAFIVGWNVTLEYLCGTAYVSRSLSGYMDLMTEGKMSAFYRKVTPIPGNTFAEYFDIMAFFTVILMGILIGSGVRVSTKVHALLTSVNFLVIMFIIVAGAFKADPHNWFLSESEVPEGKGKGGFFPYGIEGTFHGAAIVFYGFVGFESLTYAGEEVKNPKRNLPLAILITISTICATYCLVSIVQTMMVPYYALDPKAALVHSFMTVGWGWARFVVMPGAVCGMCASMFGAIMPLPRLLMAMASDGLIFHCLSRVNNYTQTPVIATIVSTVVMALLSGFLDLSQLILMLCVGTLLSYTSVAICVMVTRYLPGPHEADTKITMQAMMRTYRTTTATNSSACWAIVGLVMYILICIISSILWIRVPGTIIIVGVLHAVMVVLLLIIFLQPQKKWTYDAHTFKTPLVPLLPLISIYINIHLMVLLEPITYKRASIWFSIGIPIYIICIFMYQRYKMPGHSPHVGSGHSTPRRMSHTSIASKSSKRGHTTKQEKKLTRMGDPSEQTEQNVSQFGQNEVIILQQSIVESNEEKEAKIIELLDQVLQAEEDSYGATAGLREQTNDAVPMAETHRKSLGELSDVGSDASVSIEVLSKYDVVAQVHREDLPKVSEEDEKNEVIIVSEKYMEPHDIQTHNVNMPSTVFEDSETNSHTDESGYSDTMKSTINESIDDTIHENTPYIPTPPPLDESLFAKPVFHKSYSFTSRPPKVIPIKLEEEDKPRVSIQSNGSLDDGHIVFGTDKQMNFMTKLNTIFQSKMVNESDDMEQRRRSHSTGNVVDNTELKQFEFQPTFADLNRELLKEASHKLKPVLVENSDLKASSSEADIEEPSMSRDEMKSKLESIFANGGPQLIKPRITKSITSTAENSQTNEPSTEQIIKAPKIEKNDTLKRQKDRFSAVLNSFMLNLNKESEF